MMKAEYKVSNSWCHCDTSWWFCSGDGDCEGYEGTAMFCQPGLSERPSHSILLLRFGEILQIAGWQWN